MKELHSKSRIRTSKFIFREIRDKIIAFPRFNSGEIYAFNNKSAVYIINAARKGERRVEEIVMEVRQNYEDCDSIEEQIINFLNVLYEQGILEIVE